MSFLRAILDCFTADKADYQLRATKASSYTDDKPDEEEDQLASEILRVLFTAEKPGKDLTAQIDNIVRLNGWYEGLAKRILNRLVEALESGAVMGPAMKDAFEKASDAAKKFVHDHPVFTAVLLTVVAIGILVLLVPWVVEALGFSELGPVEGSFAALWQSTFPDAEAGSFFSYLQRLGMKWGKK